MNPNVMLYGCARLSDRRPANLRNATVVDGAHTPLVDSTIWVKEPCSTSMILLSYALPPAHACDRMWPLLSCSWRARVSWILLHQKCATPAVVAVAKKSGPWRPILLRHPHWSSSGGRSLCLTGRLHCNVGANLCEELGQQVPYPIVPDGWHSSFWAAQCMVEALSLTTCTVWWRSLKLPSVPDAQCISKGLLVEAEPKLLDG